VNQAGPSTDDLLKIIGMKQVMIEWLEDQNRALRDALEKAVSIVPPIVEDPPGPEAKA
jgi:hypothetical protein